MTEQVQVWRQGPAIFLTNALPHRDALRRLPAATYLPKYGVWRCPATPHVAGTIFTMFGAKAAVYDREFNSLLRSWHQQVNRNAEGGVPWPDNVALTPWKHQVQGYQYIQTTLGQDTGAAGLFAGMGTGKTLTAIAVLAARQWRRTLIVCPKNMIRTWEDDINTSITDGSIVATALTGTMKERAKILQDTPRSDDGPGHVFITNYDSVWARQLGAQIERDTWDAFILDEAQAIKSAGSKVSLFMLKMQKHVPFRLALTGTPAHDRTLDVYGIYRFLDPGIFGTNWNRFLKRYAITEDVTTGSGKHFQQIIGYQNQEELSEKMYRIAFRVPESVLDLPESTSPVRRIDLSPAAMRAYEKFKKEKVLQVDGTTALGSNALTKLLRLQQITSGYLPVEDDETGEETIVEIDDRKAAALSELLAEIPANEPIVIFARFRRDLDNIRKAVTDAGRVYFEESGRTHEWETFQKSGNDGGDVIGVQINAGSAGINLTRAAICVFYSLGYSLGDYDQAKRRVLRPGQHRPVQYIHLIARGTVDEQILKALKEKRSVSDYVVEQLRAEWGRKT